MSAQTREASILDTKELHIEPNLAKASTLPSTWYFKPEALDLERERIFASTWQLVGHLAKLSTAGDYFTSEVAGEPIVVVRSLAGHLRAYFNVCRHRGGPVAMGEGNVKVLKCAYHGWLYDLEGALRTTPEFAGVQCFDKSDHGLVSIPIDTWGPFIFVNIRGTGPSLQQMLGKIPLETAHLPIAEMQFYKRIVYEIDCNWKVYVDNYLEGYHIPQLHPGLMREVDYPRYRTECERYYSKQHAPIRNKSDSLYRRNLAPDADAQALYYWVFPNLMLNIYPDNLQINVIIPLGPEKTATVFEWYLIDAHRQEVVEDFARSMAFSDEVQKEDILICEVVQKGLRSRSYDRGRFSVEREGGVHHFHGLVSEFLRRESP